jgi:poly-gamma-glutamate synthesis protein (capsule biosynthesis protein)
MRMSSLRLYAVGDIMLFGRYDDIAIESDPLVVFEQLQPLLGEADVVVGNLECVLSVAGEPRRDKLCLKANPSYAKALRHAGFNLLTLANNHAFDFGPEGYRDTRVHLEDAGIEIVGAGDDLNEAREPVRIDYHGIRLAVFGYCHESTNAVGFVSTDGPGVAPLVREHVLEDIDKWRSAVDHIVLVLHWGLEYSPYPTPEQATFAKEAIDAGASLVLGHHSHMLQGIQRYKHGVIAYSLANLTDSDVDWEGRRRRYVSEVQEVDRESILFRVELTKSEIRELDHLPLWLDDDGRPVPAEGDRASKIRSIVEERSTNLEDRDLEQYWQDTLVQKRVWGPLSYWWRSDSLLDKMRRFNLGQIKTLGLLLLTMLKIKISRRESKWMLFNPRNDTQPMPYAGPEGATTKGDDERN